MKNKHNKHKQPAPGLVAQLSTHGATQGRRQLKPAVVGKKRKKQRKKQKEKEMNK